MTAIPAQDTFLQANLLKPLSIKVLPLEEAKKRLAAIEAECPCSCFDAHNNPELYEKRAAWRERRDAARFDVELAEAAIRAKSPNWNIVSADALAKPTMERPKSQGNRAVSIRMEPPEYYANRVAELVELMGREEPGSPEWARLRNLATGCRQKAKGNAIALGKPIPEVVDIPGVGRPPKPPKIRPDVHMGRPCTRGNDPKTVRRRERDRIRKARWRKQREEAANG